MSKPTKTAIQGALKSLAGIREMTEEIRQFDGNHAANRCYAGPITVESARNALAILRQADPTLLPDWIRRDWKYFRTLGWHNESATP